MGDLHEERSAASLEESGAVDRSDQEKKSAGSEPLPPLDLVATGEQNIMSNEDGELIDYKTLTWWQGGIVLIAETVSLGILSLPSVLATVGLVPGIVLILFMSVLSTYSGLVLAEFRKEYPFVHNFGDALEVIGKPLGMGRLFQEVFGWAQVIFQVFVMGSHLLTWTICMNTLSNSSTCTLVWAFVGLGVFWVLNLPRTLKYTSWMSMASCLSITVAVMITLGDVAVERPIGSGSIAVAQKLGFTHAFLAVTNIAISFSSHSVFFSVIAEFKKPEDWPKALALLQICDTALYILAAVVIYVFVGEKVPSPALSAAGSHKMRQIIWGIAIPTIVIAGVIYGHVAAKYIFKRIFRNTKHMVRRTKLSTIAWVGLTAGIWTISLIIAESIPIFNNLLGLICAIFASWFSYGLPGIFWLWMHHGNWFANWKQICRFAGSMTLLLAGILICVLGLWASIEAIADNETTKPWTSMTTPSPSENKVKMLRGEVYYAMTPELAVDRAKCKVALRAFNTSAGAASRRESVRLFRELVGDTTPLPSELPDAAADEAQFDDEPVVEPPIYMDYGTQVKLGKGVFINANSTWIDTCDITIGARTLFGPSVSLFSGTHPVDPAVRNGLKGPESGKAIHIEEDCWIGGNATILPGITIGRGSTVGAGSVVTKGDTICLNCNGDMHLAPCGLLYYGTCSSRPQALLPKYRLGFRFSIWTVFLEAKMSNGPSISTTWFGGSF
ncbi:hypothetical protein G7046_g7381 [Stylonectria norvegica]|nr:hypothetical protein G7046_g7381 [Stylonectria norvegica]